MGSEWTLAVEPRAWQERAFALWRSQMRGIAAVVTGAGKTLLAEMCMLAFREAFPDGRCVVIVPTLALLDQWYVSVREDLHVHERDIATYSGEGHPAQPARVNLMVLNTARRIAPLIASRFDTFLIVDECHRAASPVNALALRGPHPATLGLSATPERDYDAGLEDVLIPALGGVIFKYDYNDALRDGVISRFELVNVAIQLSTGEQQEYDALSRRVAVLLRRLRQGEPVEETLRRSLRTRAVGQSCSTNESTQPNRSGGSWSTETSMPLSTTRASVPSSAETISAYSGGERSMS